MKTTRYGIDPDPKTVDVRMKALASNGLSAESFGITDFQLRHHIDPSRPKELEELIKIDPARRAALAEFLPENNPLRRALSANGHSSRVFEGVPGRPTTAAGNPGANPNGRAKDTHPGIADQVGEAIKRAPSSGEGAGGEGTSGEGNPRPPMTREQLVAAMNEKYCWLDDEKVIFDMQYFVTRKRDQVHTDMAHLSTTEVVDGKKRTVTALTAWSTSPDRRRYAGRKFMPGQKPFFDTDIKGKPLGGVFVNLWRGWGCKPVKGNVEPFLNLIARLCDFNKAEIKYLTWRLAIKIQKPWMKIPSYILIVTSDEGTGKSQLVKFIVGLYGAHGKTITDREMESNFDDWKAAGILMAGAEEVSFKEKRSVANRLKAIASMEVDHINPKGQPSYQVENFYDMFFTANQHDAIYIRNDRERRPFVVMHNPITEMSKNERDEAQFWYDNGGKEALLYFLMNEVNGDDFDPYAPTPNTAGKTEMAEASRNPAEQFVSDLMTDAADDLAHGREPCPLRNFTALLKDYAGARVPDKRDEKTLSTALGAAGLIGRRLRIHGNEKITLYPVVNAARWRKTETSLWAEMYTKSSGGQADDTTF